MLDGLSRKANAPLSKSRCWVVSSASAEMKIIGRSNPLQPSTHCSSAPLIPGKFTSRIRHALSENPCELRNSSAEAKDLTVKPADVRTRHNIRDMDWSSSTTEMMVFVVDTLLARR